MSTNRRSINLILESRRLADYILTLNSFQVIQSKSTPEYNHIGGLFTDIVLQAGLNYKSVVLPRVKRILSLFPEAMTVSSFKGLIEEYGIEYVINWNHFIKQNRIIQLINFSEENSVDNCDDLRSFLIKPENRMNFLEMNGFGPKTLDYCLKLLNFECVAVDRHIYSFVGLAGIPFKDYQTTKMVVEFAADFLNISRSSLDKSIWNFMSRNEEDHYSSTTGLRKSSISQKPSVMPASQV